MRSVFSLRISDMTYQQLREVSPSDHPEDTSNVLEELLRDGRISGGSEGYRVPLSMGIVN